MRRHAVFLIAVPLAAACIRLGFWQLSRLDQRRAGNALARAALAQPPLALRIDSALVPFRRAVAMGAFDFDRQVVEEGRSFEGRPAVVVVTPLRLPGGAAILVERGWVSSPDGRRVPLGQFEGAESQTVRGLLVEPAGGPADAPDSGAFPLRVRRARPASLQAAYPYPLLPLLLRREDLPPARSPTALRAVPPPVLSDGPHLSYAIQWFAFAVIAVVGSVALFRREAGSGKGEA